MIFEVHDTYGRFLCMIWFKISMYRIKHVKVTSCNYIFLHAHTSIAKFSVDFFSEYALYFWYQLFIPSSWYSYLFAVLKLSVCIYQIIYKARMISQGVFFSLLDRFLSVLEACSMFDLWLCVVKYSNNSSITRYYIISVFPGTTIHKELYCCTKNCIHLCQDMYRVIGVKFVLWKTQRMFRPFVWFVVCIIFFQTWVMSQESLGQLCKI